MGEAMRRIRRSLLAAVALTGFSAPAAAYVGLCCGKCGGNMPMNIPGGGVPETCEFRFKLSPMFMRMDGLRDGTGRVDGDSLLGMPSMGKFMAVPTYMDMAMVNLAVGYSFTDDFFAGAMFMWKRNIMGMKFNAVMQSLAGVEGFTMESQGLADTMLMAKYRLFADDPLIPTRQASLFLGLSLPTGSLDERNTKHPVAARRTELLPYSMQLGSGTVDPTIGFLYQGSRSPRWWGANFMFTGRLYDNKRDWRLGNEFRADLYAMYQLRYDLVAEFQLNASWRGKIRGEMNEAVSGASGHAVQGDPASPYTTPSWDPDNYGGRQVFATLGLQWQPAPLHIVNLQAGLPLYRNLNGPQLETDWQVMLTWYREIPTTKSIRYMGRPAPESRLGF